MTSSADLPIAALRSGHDRLSAHVRALSPEALTGRSGAAEWSIAQVLSHLGSGAEINLASLDASLGTKGPPPADLNEQVWARWNAMEPQDQVDGFLTANQTLVRRYESIDDDARNVTRIDLGFMPAPVDLATAANFRLNEFTLHSWDVRVAADPQATLAPDAVEPLLGLLPFLMGWLGKPGSALDGRAVTVAVSTTSPDTDFGLDITEGVALTAVPEGPDASLSLPAESWLRLVTGRLGADFTPAEVSVAGPLSLDELRSIFPGF